MIDKTGYLHIKNYFDPKELSNQADKTIKSCQEINWKYIKVYHNIFIYKFINIFAINFPFNNKLNPDLYNEFIKINFKNLILKNTTWKNFEISQVELQHNEKYNYQSAWHRDSRIANLENIVIIVYLRDEKGFKLVPKNIEQQMIDKYPFFKEKNYKHGYTNLLKQFYHQFDAKAGDIVIFDAGLLHQGNSKGKRTHFFVRCIKSEVDNIDNSLKPDALLENLELESAKNNLDLNQNYYLFNSRIKSLVNLILYFSPILKIFKYIIDYKNKKIHFHYSIFQK
jgi:hypothetical protein